MFIEAVIGSFIGSALASPKVASNNGEQLWDTNRKLDGMNTTLTDMKGKITSIEIEQSRMFHEFQWHDLVQTLMAKNAVYLGNNILELKENDSVVQLNLVEKSITETKFSKTYIKTFDGREYMDGKCIHYKDSKGEKWFDLEGNCVHEVDSNGNEAYCEYDASNRCIHKKVDFESNCTEYWYEYFESNCTEYWYEYDTSNRCIHLKVESGIDYAEYWWEFDTEGKVIRHRIKQKLFTSSTAQEWPWKFCTANFVLRKGLLRLGYREEVLNEILVEYGNVVHLVSKIDEVVKEECYATKDEVYNEKLYSYFINEYMKGYFTSSIRDICGGVLYYKDDYKEIWTDANGEIVKGHFNFLTHTYEKRIAIAKQKLEETKSNIKKFDKFIGTKEEVASCNEKMRNYERVLKILDLSVDAFKANKAVEQDDLQDDFFASLEE